MQCLDIIDGDFSRLLFIRCLLVTWHLCWPSTSVGEGLCPLHCDYQCEGSVVSVTLWLALRRRQWKRSLELHRRNRQVWETAFNLEWLRCSWAFEKRRGIILLNFMVFLLLLLLWVPAETLRQRLEDLEQEKGHLPWALPSQQPALRSFLGYLAAQIRMALHGTTQR